MATASTPTTSATTTSATTTAGGANTVTFKNDQVLWYNNGIWGTLGYAVPNFGDGAQTQNETIQYLVQVIGRNMQALLHSPDVDLRKPPSINTLTRIHKLVMRARSIIAGRAVPSGTPDFEAVHVQPGAMDQLMFPMPYFAIRNSWLREYTGLILNCLAEMCQHTENRKPYEISVDFGGLVGAYMTRIYTRMATELFQIAPAVAQVAGYAMQPTDLASYNPSSFFTSTEMIDTLAPITSLPTDIDLTVLTNGIPASQLVGLAFFPSGAAYNPSAPSTVTVLGAPTAAAASASTATGTAAAAATTPPAFPAAPGP